MMCLDSHKTRLPDIPESCTASEAVELVGGLAKRLAIATEAPTLRTLHLWRGKKLLSHSGRQLTRRNLLEILGIMRLRGDGLTTGAAAEKCRALDEERLLLLLTGPQPASPTTANRPDLVTLQLLAKGILAQYRLVTQGVIVGHSGDRRVGVENPPVSLRQASALLGRLYFEEGREDLVASLHTLLERCTTPLHQWAPRAISRIPDVADAMLIDPEYRVPSEDCEVIAQQAGGGSLDDLVENRLHSDLMQTLDKLGEDADAAYTIIREFVGLHPLATTRELHGLFASPELPTAAVEFVHSLYRPAHADSAVGRLVHRCQYCQGPIAHDGRCALQGCREDHPRTQARESISVDDALVARPEVLKYWADPAREELRLFNELRRARIPVELYPHSDRCDVAIGEEVGVDVKDYRDPVSLARKLNMGIGGLAYYGRAILAVADRRARSGDYIARVREQLMPDRRQRLEVLSVGEAIDVLRRDYGDHERRGGNHARQA